MLPGAWMRVQVHLDRDLPHAALRAGRGVLLGLGGHEVLDERVRGLGVERERMLEALQLLGLVDVGHLEPVAPGVEVLLDHLQAALEHRALLGGQTLLSLLQVVLRDTCWK